MIPEYLSLERAVSNFKNNQTQKNAEILRDKMISSTYCLFLHPGFANSLNDEKKKQLQADLKAGKASSVSVMVMETGTEAGKILPVFTSPAQMKAFPQAERFVSAEVAFPALYEMIRSSENVDNILINPEGDPIAFNRKQFLDSFQISKAITKPHHFEAGTVLTHRQGKTDPADDAQKALIHAVQSYPEISAVWLTQMKENDGPEKWMIILKTDTPRSDGHQILARQFLQARGHGEAGICYSDSEIAQDVCTRLEALYTRE